MNGPVRPQRRDWPVTVAEAREIQTRLAPLVVRRNEVGQVRHVAATDLSPPNADGITHAAAVLVLYPGLSVVEWALADWRPTFPYVPGLLAFREAPALLAALDRLERAPDLLLVDGHGVAHPRRFGIACYVGLLTGVPTIGVAKGRLVGEHEEPGANAGDWTPLCHEGEVIGAAVRTRADTKPIYVSIGNRVDLQTAIAWALRCCRRFRLPEPLRQAHLAAAGRLKAPCGE